MHASILYYVHMPIGGYSYLQNKCVLGLIETFLKKHIVLRLQGDRSTNKLVHVPGCFFLHTLMRGGLVN